MRYDRIRRVLVVVVAGLISLPAALFGQSQKFSPARAVQLSFVAGAVTVTAPGEASPVPASINPPIEEGSKVSTLDGGLATLKLENGSTIHLEQRTQANFTKLGTDAGGNRLNVITLEHGQATFEFIPDKQSTYAVKIADATLSPHGKTEFLADFIAGKMQVRVSAGSVSVAAHSAFLTLAKGKFMEYRPSPETMAATSHARVVRLSFVNGTVTLKRPGSAEDEPARLNTPIQEGFELSTAAASYAEVEFENGSTARIGEQSKILFHQLALDANGNKLNGMTFEQGYATFHFVPERNAAPQHEQNGAINLPSEARDTYQVKFADATVTAEGKCEFRTDLDQDHYRVEVFVGSVNMSTATKSLKLGEGKVAETKSSSSEALINTRGAIVKDNWDLWTEARDKQSLLTAKDESVHPVGPSYGWGELNTYGEWVSLPGGRFGWSPYAQAGWSPYTMGSWQWYPGFGWTWVSGEPWGWVTDHCGAWDFDLSFGWYWMNPMFGCGLWMPSLVNWFEGPGWIGWAPSGTGRPRTRPPGGGPHRPPQSGAAAFSRQIARGIITVPTSVVQNRQTITPQIVSRVEPATGNAIDHPAFQPNPLTTSAAAPPTSAAGTQSASISTAASIAAPAFVAGRGSGFAWNHAAAPSTILMGGDPAKEGSLLENHDFPSRHAPLRAAEGTTLGGRYTLHGSPGGFRGNASAERQRNGNAGSVSGPSALHATGGQVAIVPHGQGAASSHSSGFSGGGSLGGGSHGTGGGAVGGGGFSSGGGHSGGGFSGGGGAVSSGGGGASAGGGGGGHH